MRINVVAQHTGDWSQHPEIMVYLCCLEGHRSRSVCFVAPVVSPDVCGTSWCTF